MKAFGENIDVGAARHSFSKLEAPRPVAIVVDRNITIEVVSPACNRDVYLTAPALNCCSLYCYVADRLGIRIEIAWSGEH